MDTKINVKAASVAAIQEAVGESIKAQVKAWGSTSDFIEVSGVPRSSLYRLFNGETIGSDMLLKVLHTLGRFDALEALTRTPPQNPLDFVFTKQRRRTVKKKPPVGRLTSGLALPQYKNHSGFNTDEY